MLKVSGSKSRFRFTSPLLFAFSITVHPGVSVFSQVQGTRCHCRPTTSNNLMQERVTRPIIIFTTPYKYPFKAVTPAPPSSPPSNPISSPSPPSRPPAVVLAVVGAGWYVFRPASVVLAPVVVLDALSRGSADRGPAVNVAVEGLDSEPVSSLPMNQAGTQPLSPVSDRILIGSA